MTKCIRFTKTSNYSHQESSFFRSFRTVEILCCTHYPCATVLLTITFLSPSMLTLKLTLKVQSVLPYFWPPALLILKGLVQNTFIPWQQMMAEIRLDKKNKKKNLERLWNDENRLLCNITHYILYSYIYIFIYSR